MYELLGPLLPNFPKINLPGMLLPQFRTISAMQSALQMIAGTALAAWGKMGQQTLSGVPGAATMISPQVTQPQYQTRKRIARMGGRQSTLLTGGLLGNPALLRQGLYP